MRDFHAARDAFHGEEGLIDVASPATGVVRLRGAALSERREALGGVLGAFFDTGKGVEHVFVGPDRVRLCLRAVLGPEASWEDEADLWRELHGTYGALLVPGALIGAVGAGLDGRAVDATKERAPAALPRHALASTLLAEMKVGWFEMDISGCDERVFDACDRIEALCLARKLRHGYF